MNILLINHYAGSKKHGMEYRPYYLAREWIKLGHKVTIIGASYSHVRTIQPNVDKKWTEEIIDGIRYIWIKTPEYQGNGVKRVVNMLSFVISIYRYKEKITQEVKPNVVIASSTYPLDIYPAKAIADISKAKLIFEVHDLWPLSPMELGGMSPYHPFIFTMQLAENYAYKHCDHVVSLLPKAKEHMVGHGLQPNKFNYIPNGISLDEWEEKEVPLPDNLSNKIQELKENGQILVGYAGGHNISNALEDFLEAIKLTKNDNISYLFVGKGTEKSKLKKYAETNKLNNVFFFDPIPKDAVPSFLRKMDILYLGWKKKSIYRFGVSPNKLLDYMMSKKPILHAIEAGNDLVSESNCGVSVEPENPRAISNGLLKLASMSVSERERLGNNGFNYVLNHHDYSKLAKKFIEIIQ
jgi:glycosyltransferase involved in cell wall biosynthesis